jgi:hypothetical protein
MVTALECIQADGSAPLSPLYIFKGKHLWTSWYENDTSGGHYAVSSSGWTNEEVAYHWITEVFDLETQDKADQTCCYAREWKEVRGT